MPHKRSQSGKNNKNKNMRKKWKAKKNAAIMVEQYENELQENRVSRQVVALKRQNQLLKDALTSKQKKLSKLMQKYSYTSLNAVQPKSSTLTVCDTFTSMPSILDETCYSIVYHSHLCGVLGRINVVYFHDIRKQIAQKVVSLDKCSELSIMAEAVILQLLPGHSLFPYCYGFQRPNMIFFRKLRTI